MKERLKYAYQKSKEFWPELQGVLNDPKQHLETLTDLTLEDLQDQNVKILALDFDGVMAVHGKEKAQGGVMLWLDDLVQKWGVDHICILSNKPTHKRKGFFEGYYPGMAFISDVPKKPYPDGLAKIAELKKVAPHEILLVDDRMLTGVLAALIAGTQVRYVTHPFVAHHESWMKEGFFASLRWAEKWALRRFNLKKS